MARLITVYWRDIPSQVTGRGGRENVKVLLSERFQIAIDRAAMRAGKGSSEAYLEEWRRESRTVEGDLKAAVEAEAQRLEEAFPDELLERLVRGHGDMNRAREKG